MRQIFTALFCILFTVNALAADVTKNNAAKVATNFFSEAIITHGINHAAIVSESFDITKDDNTVLYVFNFENGGFVIVSADDRFAPIIGYSPDGFYKKDKMSEGFKFLMKEFSEMITLIRDENIAAKPEYTAKWERYESDNLMPDRGVAAEIVIPPLTALWNQDSPYNYYAPLDAGGPGGKAYAGCVATAMSMIMYYWRWPLQGVGEKTYTPPRCTKHGTIFDPQTANFGETHYDYNGMYGTPEITADNYLYEPIALLQYHAGVSVSMAYCSDGSGAQSANVPPALKNYFKYDPSVQQVQKGSKPTSEWTAMMKDQLNLKQPVYVSGVQPGASAGHAFVCDGYRDDDMFHYNFGWSGYENGYFISDKPDVYTSNVAAVINFIPDRSQGYPSNCSGDWTIPYMKGMLADCSGPIDKYAAGTTSTWLIDPAVGGNIVDNITISCNEIDLAAGDYLRVYDGDNDKATLMVETSGTDAFETKTSTGGKVLVKFTSAAGSKTAQGFMITYEAKPKKYCTSDITLTAASGTFTDGSPEEMNYPNGTSCKWYIEPYYFYGAPDETKITFTFNRLDTEKGSDLIKFYDYYGGTIPKAIISGNNKDTIVTIPTKKVMVTFSSNSYANGKGFEIEYSVSPVSIKEVENINDFSIYPNPASDKLNIKFNTSTADDFNITIYNVTGQEVYNETLNNFMGSYHNELTINDFAQGVYLMQIKSSKGAITKKVVVQ